MRTDRWSCRECHSTRLSDEGNRLGGISEEGVASQTAVCPTCVTKLAERRVASQTTVSPTSVTKLLMPPLSAPRNPPPRPRSRRSVTRREHGDNAHLPAKLERECSRVQTAPRTKCCTKTKTSAVRFGSLGIQRPDTETKTSPVEPDSGASSGGVRRWWLSRGRPFEGPWTEIVTPWLA